MINYYWGFLCPHVSKSYGTFLPVPRDEALPAARQESLTLKILQ